MLAEQGVACSNHAEGATPVSGPYSRQWAARCAAHWCSLKAMDTLDLIIIGAGPAGLSTAMHLVQADPSWAERLLILEKQTHPRHKLCGGGVTRFGLSILEQLGIALPLPLPQAIVEDAQLVFGDRIVHVRNRPEFIVFQRAELDAYLAEEARARGIRILEDTPVRGLHVDAQGVQVSTPGGALRARLLAGADGAKGITRRLAASPKDPIRVARLLETVTAADGNTEPFAQRSARFDFTSVSAHLQGYVWEFPSYQEGKPCFNRGVFDARIARNRPRARLMDLLRRHLDPSEPARPPARIEGHPIPLFSPRNRFAVPRILLVGDAAGADPLFGEGIAPALGYGAVAARAIEIALASGDLSFRDYRRRVLSSPLGRYLLLRWAVAWWSYRLSASQTFMHSLWTAGAALAPLNRLLR